MLSLRGMRAVLWGIGLLLASIHAADIPGIVLKPGVPDSAGAESGDTFSCLAVIYPYSTWQPNVNASAQQPSSSPVPPYVEGSIDFSITNTGGNTVQAPWTLGIYNPVYTEVLQVWNFDFVNATQGQVYGNASASYETLQANQNNTVYLGILVQAALNTIRPSNITVNGQECVIQLVNNITSYNAFPRSSSQAGTESAEQPVSISNGKIIGVDGNEVTMKAVNWFGFNNGATMFDGLYAGSTSLSQDFGVIAYRIQALGFNAIRVPFSFQALFNSQPNSFTKQCTPSSQEDLRNNLTPPNTNVAAGAQLPTQAFPQNNEPSVCNQNLPNDSVYHRFLYIIQFLVRNNFYVLIDDHSEDPTIQNDPDAWVGYWAALMKDITADPPSRNRVMVDLLNEPDHAKYTWDQLGPLYLAAMDAIYAVETAKSTLFFIEGTGQNAFPGLNWGDGFVTNAQLIQQYGLSDPNPFFQSLLTKPYLNNMGVTPHVYPPSITFASQGYQGDSLYFRLYNSFGYLSTVGYGGHLFPIFIGETGSKFITQTDIESMNDIAKWLRADPNTGTQHNAVPHVAYWDWNANSGDTGGIVDDNWVDILWVKVQWLIDAINLQPWYLGTTSTPSTTTPAAIPPALPPASPPLVSSPPPVAPPPVESPPPPVSTTPPPEAQPALPIPSSPPPAVPEPPLATPSSPPTSVPEPPSPIPSTPPSPLPSTPSSPLPSTPPSPAPEPPSPIPPTPPSPVLPTPSPPVSAPPSPVPVPPSPPTPTPTSPLPVSPPTPSSTLTVPLSSIPIVVEPPPSAPIFEEAAPRPAPASSPPSSPAGSSCEAYSTEATPWPSGTGVTASSVNVFLKNTGDTLIPIPYTVAVQAPGITNTQYSWNWEVTATASGTQTGTVNWAQWENLQPNGQNVVNVGSVVESSSDQLSSFTPTAVSINGVSCTIVAPQNPGS